MWRLEAVYIAISILGSILDNLIYTPLITHKNTVSHRAIPGVVAAYSLKSRCLFRDRSCSNMEALLTWVIQTIGGLEGP
jgi:hypothetical protein